MDINRNNYEIWLIDLIDGNLDDHQRSQVELFLKQNPDLMDEFKELSLFRLSHKGDQFVPKERLKKSINDLSVSQFEYLSVGFLENDLSGEEKTELNELIKKDTDKRNSFHLIQKTKLSPVSVTYKNKKKLLRRTTTEKIIRLAAIGLSAAAVSTVIIVTYLSPHKNSPENNISISFAEEIPSPAQQPLLPVEKDEETEVDRSGTVTSVSQEEPVNLTFVDDDLAITQQVDTSAISFPRPTPDVIKIPVPAIMTLAGYSPMNNLAVLNYDLYPEMEVTGSRTGKFLTAFFREKILRTDPSPESSLKGYEIAEAGVKGLNRLLGWEMEFVKDIDEKGEVNSFHFSSKLLTINSPVKKDNPLQ